MPHILADLKTDGRFRQEIPSGVKDALRNVASRRRPRFAGAMTWLGAISLIAGVLLVGYLVVALVRAERF